MIIYKYLLDMDYIADKQSVELSLPSNATILTIAIQHEKLCLWALFDPADDLEVRKIVFAVTGHEFGDPSRYVYDYIATLLLNDGNFVLHAFEESRFVHH